MEHAHINNKAHENKGISKITERMKIRASQK
jgi:hypothetical protein